MQLVVGDPPLGELTVGGVAHQQFPVREGDGFVVVGVADQLNVAPIRAEIDTGELILRVDPPFIEVMIDRILHQHFVLIGGDLVVEKVDGNELDVGPIRTEIDARELPLGG